MEGFDYGRIQEILPHRYPFLLIDRVTELVRGERLVGYKNVTINEDFFNGHFPGNPVMPGVLILEALAQAGALLAYESDPLDLTKKVIFLAGIDDARLRRPVRPGDKLELHATIARRKGPVWKLSVHAMVDGQRVAEALLTATSVDK
ncbi:3-hydroxyacyl-ACP dehydratase FabZ [Vulgatibacter incomptus]|uniref:3-hydroxyacyl-[acyl-carrier-protein] dehydratase FabZ n=1 Tax=Vulgatibacter incomptus TaxID=1391653 RepID=A0A0K1PDM7_9BACT|nr:3-hydroxyacyl-ACP dehydratase FabZ [Vulgatibacter incomptus]AKU91516.1 3-hydroxyacyl-[acyl-carrier-protein] dehydratase, FabZ form [Vulgatibacter incomptus]